MPITGSPRSTARLADSIEVAELRVAVRMLPPAPHGWRMVGAFALCGKSAVPIY
jgi:hypothetical protein